MTARAKFDDWAFHLPGRPPISARSRRTIDATAAQTSAVDLLALDDGAAQPVRDVEPDDLLIAKACQKRPYSARARTPILRRSAHFLRVVRTRKAHVTGGWPVKIGGEG
jgi:hypothetical protein